MTHTPSLPSTELITSSLEAEFESFKKTASECPLKTGTLAQVACTSIFGSSIFFVSQTNFISSFVKALSKKISH